MPKWPTTGKHRRGWLGCETRQGSNAVQQVYYYGNLEYI